MPENKNTVISYIVITTALQKNDEATVDLMSVPNVPEMFAKKLEDAKNKSKPLLESIDDKLTKTPNNQKEIAHTLLCEVQGYLSAYTHYTNTYLIYCDAYDHIETNYAEKAFVDRLELSDTYSIPPEKATIFPEILKKHPHLIPPVTYTAAEPPSSNIASHNPAPTESATTASAPAAKIT